jgi:hypothetical protein
MNNKRDRLIYLAGGLYRKTAALRELLEELAETNEAQGEIRLSYRNAEDETATLFIHVDGADFSMMPDESDGSFRLNLSGPTLTLE